MQPGMQGRYREHPCSRTHISARSRALGHALFGKDRECTGAMKLASAHTPRIRGVWRERPIVTAAVLLAKTGLTPAAVNKSLVQLMALDMVRELTRQKRNRVYSHTSYLDIPNQGTERLEA